MPAAPSALQGAIASDNSGVLLQWQNNAEQCQYLHHSTLHQRFDFSTDLQQFTAPRFHATSYEDTTAAPQTTYYYRLAASNSGGTSDYTAAITYTFTPMAPAAPSNLQAEAPHVGSIRYPAGMGQSQLPH